MLGHYCLTRYPGWVFRDTSPSVGLAAPAEAASDDVPERAAGAVAWGALLLFGVVALRLATLRFLANDDYQILHWAWLRSVGPALGAS